MASYDDQVGDAQGIMYMNKYEGSDNAKQGAFKLWNYGFKAAPKSGVSIAHSRTHQDDGAQKDATKVGMKHGDAKWDLAFANDKYSAKVSGPLSKDDWKVDGSLQWEEKPAKQRKMVGTAGVESPDMSGTTTVMNLSAEQVWKINEKGEAKNENPKLNFDLNVNIEKDYNVGFAVEHDTAELAGAEAGVSKVDGNNKYWLGYDHGNQFVKAGCLQHYADKNFTHAYEGRWHLGEKAGFMGQPLWLAGGGKYVLSGQTTMNYMLELGAKPHAQAKFDHKVDKNWKLGMHQSFDCNAEKPYKVGFDVNYTL